MIEEIKNNEWKKDITKRIQKVEKEIDAMNSEIPEILNQLEEINKDLECLCEKTKKVQN